jgi:TolB-like protein
VVPPPDSAPATSSVRRVRRWFRAPLALTFVLGALIVATLGLLLWQRSNAPIGSRRSSLAQPSIAVLPFANLSPERANEYFSDGMTEELISALGRVEGLRVAARSSSFAFKGRALDVGEVSRKLNVATVLDGSVRREGSRLRVTAELVEAREGTRLWADRYDRDLRDVFQVQDELARAIVRALRVPLKLASRPDGPLVRAATTDPAAHDLYLQGRFLWNQRNHESLLRAARYFERAAARDSSYAEAYAGLADTYVLLPLYGSTRPTDAYPRAEAAALRALALDSTGAEAHASLGLVRMYANYDWGAAEAEFLRAIALNPSYATAHHWYGDYLRAVGRLEESLAATERARVLDPLSRIIAADLSYTLLVNRRYDDAIRQARAALELDPTFERGLNYLCVAYLYKRMPREATTACERAAVLSGRTLSMGRLAIAYAAAGERAKALGVLRELEAGSRRRYVSPYQIAMAQLGLGDTARTFEWLERGYAVRDPYLTINLFEPLWDPVRSDPRFEQLLGRLGLPP